METWLEYIPEVTKHIKNMLEFWRQTKALAKETSSVLDSANNGYEIETKLKEFDENLTSIHNSYISLFRHGLTKLPIVVKNERGDDDWWFESKKINIESPEVKAKVYELIGDLNRLRESNWDLRVRVRSEANELIGIVEDRTVNLYLIATVLYFVSPEELANDGVNYLIHHNNLLDARSGKHESKVDSVLRTPSRFLATLDPETSVSDLRKLLESKIDLMQKAYTAIDAFRAQITVNCVSPK